MNLDIQIKDNFLSQNLFDKLSTYCTTLDYSNDNITYNQTEHVFYSNPIHEDDPLLKDLEKSLIKNFKICIKNLNLAAFTLVNTKKPTPHADRLKFSKEKHLIIYLNGDREMSSGTGFYESSENRMNLNTAVGCYPNRAILFDAHNCFHSPLLYTGEKTLPRFSIIIWFEPENKLE